MAEILKYLDYLKRIVIFFVFFFPVYMYSNFVKYNDAYKNIWLISERGDEARDNAYHLYRYIRENHAYINAHFIITKNSPDIKKVEKYGNIIAPGSFNHFLFFILAEKLVSTHLYGAAPYGKAGKYFLRLLPKKDHIFLQHGIYKDKFVIKDSVNDIIVCSSEIEAQLLSESPRNIKDTIKIVGLCRYDKLIDESKNVDKKIILFMPTFRFWLEEAYRLKNRDYIFRNDPYYIFWNDLLNDITLNKYCESMGCEIIFYPHYRSQKYLHNFKTDFKHITIADNTMYDIQDLLVKSSIMATDFSSVFFDFAYMKKPVVYYQFDEKKYRDLQYKEGSYSYKNNGFGPVFRDKDKIVNYIIDRADSSFIMEDMYLKRVSGFFKYCDHNNTERNFKAIIELRNKD